MGFAFSLSLGAGFCIFFGAGWVILNHLRKPPVKTLVDNPPVKTLVDNPLLDFIGYKGLVKKSEFIRILTDALISLGFDDIAALLEERSGIPLHSAIVKQFLKLVKDGEWDKCIDALQGFQLRDEKPVSFLLLEQKFYEVLNTGNVTDARRILKEMVRLRVDTNRVHELASQLIISAPGEDTTESVNSRSEFMEKLQDLFPPGVIIPERRLEYLIEKSLVDQVYHCSFHNVPDSDLSICYDHDCEDHKIPSETVQILEEHIDEVWFLKFSHNGRYLASSSKDKSAIIWEINAEGKFSLKHKLEGHQNPVVEVLWSPDDRQVITCGENEVIRSWDVDSGAFVGSYERNGVGSISCGWFHDGSGIIGGMADRRIYLWHLNGTEIEHEQGQRAQNLSDVAMTTDGKWLVSVGKEQHEISFFDRETNRVEDVIVEEDMITSFSLSDNNSYLLINLITQKINVWYIQGEPMKILGLDGHKRSRFIIRSCFGGYDEDFIASGSEDSQVYIWHRTEWREPCRVLSGHSGAVNCVSWNPTDMHMLASASDDGTIRIWGIDKNLN
ncbi:unnamed protein product [Arabis nemorensis]|uniref:CTLH domain-containing protein n=1 Tax=Arabis nemorensis TaxID=586526 RepID=A0A565CW31_9BRAS|nr:unnamed protein product [Arabis nemorensis]